MGNSFLLLFLRSQKRQLILDLFLILKKYFQINKIKILCDLILFFLFIVKILTKHNPNIKIERTFILTKKNVKIFNYHLII